MQQKFRHPLVLGSLFASVALVALGSVAISGVAGSGMPTEFSAQARAKGKPAPVSRAASRPAARPPAVARAPDQPVPLPRPRPGRPFAASAPVPAAAEASGRLLAGAVPMAVQPSAATASAFAPTRPPEPTGALSYAPAAQPRAGDVDAVRQAIEHARRGRTDAATELRETIRDAAGRKLVEWMVLRSNDTNPSFSRYAAFVDANPTWPSIGLIRRRAEARLWQERLDSQTVLRFFHNRPPVGTLGRLSLARALAANGDHAGALREVRRVWREDSLSAALEDQVLADHGARLSRDDHRVRLHVRLYGDDIEGAMRTARRLGAGEVALVQARAAVNRQAANAGALLEAVPQALRSDPVYVFTRVQWLRRADRTDEATRLALSAPSDPRVIHNADEWWLERRILVRRLLDAGKFQEAYQLSRGAAPPTDRMPLRVDQPFTAGWIALRFLNNPRVAAQHFAQIHKASDHPTSHARGDYWLARSAEAEGRQPDARRHFEAAARHSASYYGQLARARLGHREMTARRPPALSASARAALRQVDLVRAVELLYATGNRDLVTTFVANLDRVGDVGALTVIGEIARHNSDPRAMLYLGRDAVSRGLAFDAFAFPTAGLPNFAALGSSSADRSLVYAIARQESAFSPRAVSSARAMGYMQVTPAAGQTIARRHGVAFDARRLLNDPVYNMQFGAAEIGSLVEEYGGNHILAFAAYNAGRGRVREWLGRFGDPRDPRVDSVDWVERIPFYETRNYVQRVMENMQVYRSHFHGRAPLTIEADMQGRLR